MIGSSEPSVSIGDIHRLTTEIDIAQHYLGIKKIPCVINSTLRVDKSPSLGIYSKDGTKVSFIDFATKEKGSIFDLLKKMWNTSFSKTLIKIYKDIGNISTTNIKLSKTNRVKLANSTSTLECKVRDWEDYDIIYWNNYGISIKWLKYANVYPISHKIIIKEGKKYTFKADKYAYAYAEFKDNKTTLKIYQPYNKNGFKWSNKHDKSVISLWTKVPKKGNIICICSSLKDALCLWANTGIPSIAIQGEGYNISNTAITELKKRFANIYILLDNDKAGLEDGIKLSKETGFKNLVLPKINNAKDISDLYLSLNNKQQFKQILLKLFENGSKENCNCINQNTEKECNHVRS